MYSCTKLTGFDRRQLDHRTQSYRSFVLRHIENHQLPSPSAWKLCATIRHLPQIGHPEDPASLHFVIQLGNEEKIVREFHAMMINCGVPSDNSNSRKYNFNVWLPLFY